MPYNQAMSRAYPILCGVSGALLLLVGIALTVSFYGYHLPGGGGGSALRVGPSGAYFAGFAGTALLGWGGALIGAMRWPGLARSLGTASALALVLAALQRMVAWLMGDYAALGELPRVEAAVLLLWALAFVWLRPAPAVGGA
ncbi:MAG: hypothetical protein ABFS46_15935 [Myxococcota bacterium]